MPKKQVMGSIILIIILAFICMYIYDNFKVEKETKLIVEQKNNNNTIINYLTTKRVNYYLYNIDNIIVDYTDRTLELDKALEMKQISMKQVLSYLEEKANFNDGNTILYQNDDFSVLECKLENGNTNYIFSSRTLTYKESFCSSEPYECSFIKTYYVLDITDAKNKNYVYLTLRNNLSEEVATIEIEKDKIEELKEDKFYKFTFASSNDKVDSDIKSIFDNNKVLNIEEANSVVNENTCK